MLNLKKYISRSLTSQLRYQQQLKVIDKPKMMFGTFYQHFKNAYYIQKQHKSLGIYFANEGLKMAAYASFIGMAETGQQQNTKFIMGGNVININFVQNVDEYMYNSEDRTAWENRKVINLGLRQSMQLFKLGPDKQKSIQVTTFKPENQTLKYKMMLEYDQQQKEVKCDIQHYKEDQYQKTDIWDVNFLFSLNQYHKLTEWIKTGLFYTTGTSAMIQHDKMHKLKAAVAQAAIRYEASHQSKPKKTVKSKITIRIK